MPTVTVVMPAFNEAANLPVVAPQVITACRGACPEGFELLIVDDGSTDATPDAIAGLAAAHPEVRSLRHPHNRGLTAALRTGFYGARKDYVLFIPADGQAPADEIPAFVAAAPGHDLVLSRYRDRRPDGLSRIVLSRGLRLLLWLALGFGDRLEGPYLFRRALLDSMPLVAERSGGSIGFEIAAKVRRAGGSITTIEVACAERLSGASKVANARNILEYLDEIWRIRRSMRHL
jgi:glycosyltransferase involved in cell wall biosynthesis